MRATLRHLGVWLLVASACAPSTPVLPVGQRIEGSLAGGPVRYRLPSGVVEVVLSPGSSGAQLVLVRGEQRQLVDRRRDAAPERVAVEVSDGLEVAPPTTPRARQTFSLEVKRPEHGKALVDLDAAYASAVASTIPSSASALPLAAQALLEGAAKARALGDRQRAAEHTVTAAELLFRVSDPTAAARFTEALDSDVPETVAAAHLGLAAIDHEQGRLSAAAAHQVAARALAGDDELLNARIDVAESDDLTERGEHAQAVARLVPRLELVRREGDPWLIAEYESAIGWCHKNLGDRALTEDHFTRGHAAALLTRDGRAIGHALHDLGSIHSDFDSDWKAALPFDLKAVEVRRAAGDIQGLAYSLDAAGEMESTLLDPIALEHHAEALTLRRRIKSVRGEAQTLTSLGSALGRLNRPAEAMEPLLRAVELFQQLGDTTWVAYAWYRLGRAELMAKHYPEAVAWAEKSLGVVESLRERIASEDRRAYYTAGVRKFYDLWVAASAEQARASRDVRWVATALEASESARARALLDFLMLVDADRPHGQPELVAEEDALRAEIRGLEATLRQERAIASADAGASAIEAQLQLKLGAYEALRSRLQAADPKAASLSTLPLVTLAEVEGLAGADSLVVEYYLGRNGSYALVLGGATPQAVALGAQDPLTTSAEALHRLYSARNEEVPGETAAARASRVAAADVKAEETRVALRAALLGPFEGLLAKKKRLLVVSDGALHLVPWAALVPELPVVSAPSLSVLKAQRLMKRAAPAKGLLAVGDPVFEADDPRLGGKEVPAGEVQRDGPQARYQRLSSSRAEVEALGALVPTAQRSVWLDFEATKGRLMAGERARIVHIATHGVLDTAHPERSGLMLTRRAEDGRAVDGFLSLAEVYSLSLPADLVTLSACETALGAQVRGEGLIGLARGFLHAGAKAVVASLWKVNDRATAELMKAFYVGVLQLGLPHDKALARAQRVLASQERYRSAYYWAGFVLYGG